MNLIRLVFEIVRKFVPMDPNEYAQMRNEAEEWESKITPESDNPIEKVYAKYGRQWYVKLGFAITYMWLLAKIPVWINPVINDDDDE